MIANKKGTETNCGRKTTNRLRAIETISAIATLCPDSCVARPLIAFGRLKLEVSGRVAVEGFPGRKTTNRLRAIETRYLGSSQ